MSAILIVYGTETGNAEMLAEDLGAHLESDHAVTVRNLSDTAPGDLVGPDLVVLVASSYGEGDPPASAKPFIAKLERDAPDLGGARVAVFGLGDKAGYPETFGQGSEKLGHMVKARGATLIGGHGLHDVSGPGLAEETAIAWIGGVIAALETA